MISQNILFFDLYSSNQYINNFNTLILQASRAKKCFKQKAIRQYNQEEMHKQNILAGLEINKRILNCLKNKTKPIQCSQKYYQNLKNPQKYQILPVRNSMKNTSVIGAQNKNFSLPKIQRRAGQLIKTKKVTAFLQEYMQREEKRQIKRLKGEQCQIQGQLRKYLKLLQEYQYPPLKANLKVQQSPQQMYHKIKKCYTQTMLVNGLNKIADILMISHPQTRVENISQNEAIDFAKQLKATVCQDIKEYQNKPRSTRIRINMNHKKLISL